MSDETRKTYRIDEEFRHDLAIIAVLVLMGVAGALAFSHLPPRVPIHWGASGQPNGFGSPLTAVLVTPLIALGIWLLLVIVPSIDPRRRNYVDFLGYYRSIRLAIVLLLAVVYGVTLLAALGRAVEVGLIVTLAVSVLYIFLGNAMQRVRFNFFVGVRTPWTISNEEVWRRTHRLASRSMILGGLVALASALLPQGVHVAVFLVGIIGGAVWPAVYSFFVYRNLVR